MCTVLLPQVSTQLLLKKYIYLYFMCCQYYFLNDKKCFQYYTHNPFKLLLFV